MSTETPYRDYQGRRFPANGGDTKNHDNHVVTKVGAVLAGGRSRRFGSDKTEVLLQGVPMIDRAIDAVRPFVDQVVICGRPWRNFLHLEDWPKSDQGPLAGICAALRHASTAGAKTVFSVPVDCHPLTPDIMRSIDRRDDRACAVKEHWLIAQWPVELLMPLETFLRSGNNKVLNFLHFSGAILIPAASPIVNVNFVRDLPETSARN